MSFLYASLLCDMFSISKKNREEDEQAKKIFLRDEKYKEFKKGKNKIDLGLLSNSKKYILDFNTTSEDIFFKFEVIDGVFLEGMGIVIEKENEFFEIYVPLDVRKHTLSEKEFKEYVLSRILDEYGGFIFAIHSKKENETKEIEFKSISTKDNYFENNEKNIQKYFEKFLEEYKLKLHFVLRRN